MTITPMMQYIQDRILEAVHGCSLEEARAKDFGFGCVFRNYEEDYQQDEIVGFLSGWEEKCYDRCVGGEHEQECHTSYRIVVDKKLSDDDDTITLYGSDGYACNIGLPPTLSRVLTALETKGIFRYGSGVIEKYDGDKAKRVDFCSRTRHNTDKTDCNLFDQSQETITAIALLLGYKDE